MSKQKEERQVAIGEIRSTRTAKGKPDAVNAYKDLLDQHEAEREFLVYAVEAACDDDADDDGDDSDDGDQDS